MKIELKKYRREEGFGVLGLFNSRNTRPERESKSDDSYPDAADVAGEKAQENLEQEDNRGPGRIMLDGFLNMRDYAVDAVMGKIERAQRNRRIYQEEYEKAEKQAIKERAREDAFGKGQDGENSVGFLQNLAMGLQNTGNAFSQPPPREEDEPRRKGERPEKSEIRRSENQERRYRDDWGQLF